MKELLKGNKKNFFWIAVIALLVLIIIFSGSSNKDESENIEVIESEEVEEVQEVPAVVTQVVEEGGDVYDFSGVVWEFDTEDASVADGQTWLKMRFADFTRNGATINFGNPYKLGHHDGVCSEVNYFDTTSESGIPVSYVECSTEDATRQVVVLQELNNVVIKFRDSSEGSFSELYSVDVTDIVR